MGNTGGAWRTWTCADIDGLVWTNTDHHDIARRSDFLTVSVGLLPLPRKDPGLYLVGMEALLSGRLGYKYGHCELHPL